MTKTQAAKLLGSFGGKIGGISKSPAKSTAARKNGKRGGRPKKIKPEEKGAK